MLERGGHSREEQSKVGESVYSVRESEFVLKLIGRCKNKYLRSNMHELWVHERLMILVQNLKHRCEAIS